MADPQIVSKTLDKIWLSGKINFPIEQGGQIGGTTPTPESISGQRRKRQAYRLPFVLKKVLQLSR